LTEFGETNGAVLLLEVERKQGRRKEGENLNLTLKTGALLVAESVWAAVRVSLCNEVREKVKARKLEGGIRLFCMGGVGSILSLDGRINEFIHP